MPSTARKAFSLLLTIAIVVVVGYLITVLATRPSQPTMGEDLSEEDFASISIDALLERMAQNGASIKSGHLTIHSESTHSPRGQPPTTEVYDDEVWFDGLRVRIDSTRGAEDDPQPTRTTVLFEGTQLTRVERFSGEGARLSVQGPLTAGEAGSYLNYGCPNLLLRWPLAPAIWGTKPFAEQLADSNAVQPQVVGAEHVGDLPCIRVGLAQAGDREEETAPDTLWVAPDRGYAVARFERTVAASENQYGCSAREILEVEEWISLVEDLWLPRVITTVIEERQLDSDEVRTVQSTRTEVLSAEFNLPIPDAVGHLDVPQDAIMVPWEPSGPRGSAGPRAAE
ncbi:MAG: hypothetical protein IMF16_01760 [Proteobacteria bacterium]|nr:hypothetical protein [Pseudomonadota bacterium]